MKIVAMVGSPSKTSINRSVVEFMKDRYGDRLDIKILAIEDLPFYNYEIEDNPPQLILEMREDIREADGILFATPEYNQSIPATMKNALDWFSRVEPVLLGKPGMIMGVSPGRLGTVRAQEHLKDILTSQMVGVLPLPGTEVFIGSYYDQIDESGVLSDGNTIAFLDEALDKFINWIEKVK